ncbi:UNVERIFIED_CONTAM: hypothetical protein K2H54_026518 [Gekko kuhli]
MGPGESAAGFGALLPLPPPPHQMASSGLPSPPGAGGGGCRGRYQLLLSGRALAERYRRIYTAAALSEREQAGHPGSLPVPDPGRARTFAIAFPCGRVQFSLNAGFCSWLGRRGYLSRHK